MSTRNRLIRFYTHYCPEKLEGKKSNLDDIIRAYQGREDELFQKLSRKYGPEPPSAGEMDADLELTVINTAPDQDSTPQAPNRELAEIVDQLSSNNGGIVEPAMDEPPTAYPTTSWQMPDMKDKLEEIWDDYKLPILILLFIGFILILVLVPLSFQYIPRNQMGLKKDSKTNIVDLSTAYSTGRYFWGLGFDPVTYPSKLILVNMATTTTDLDVFTDSGQTLSIGVVFFYRVNGSTLGKLYQTFSQSYDSRLRAAAIRSMRDAVTVYSVDDFVDQRTAIAATLFNAIQTALQTDLKSYVYVERKHFTLQYINLPQIIDEQKINIFDKTQLILTNAAQYNATKYRLQTAQTVNAINNKAKFVSSQATLIAKRIVKQANALSFQSVQTELGSQLTNMVSTLGLSTAVIPKALLYSHLLDVQANANITLLMGTHSVLLQSGGHIGPN